MGAPIRSTREQIADQLRDEVFSGRWEVGERLSEADLAERFGVSRGPIREALSQLTTEGLFLAKQNCGVSIAPPAPEELHRLLLPVRRALEVYALGQIFDRLTPDDFRAWDEILFRMEHACRRRDLSQFPQLDVALHRSILERAAMPDLIAIWQVIVTRIRAHIWKTVREHEASDNLMRLHAHHVELIDAFRSGDKAVALKALTDHIDEN
jgi:DNA-binding GntR family transcriptional regulator